ncbi:hypothetical protein BH23GEM10_BH23GEM10_08150 [soil metagenome]
MKKLLLAGGILLLGGPPTPLHAQGTCRIIEVPGSNNQFSNAGTPHETVVITCGAHIICGSRTLRAETATRIAASQRIELFGNVRVEDAGRTLTAQEATFFAGTRQLAARVNVVIRDLQTGSSIRGDLVDYYQESETRPEARIEAVGTSRPARAVLFQAGETADSTIVDASQITVIGERSFVAVGNAVMTRDSMRATGFTIQYTQQSGELQVVRDGLVQLPNQEMRGDSINATIGDDDELREVLTRHGASIVSEEMNVTAPAIRLELEDGGVTRMVAMAWPAASGALTSPRPRVEAEEFIMESDSIDVLAPGGQIAEAWAIGDAYGARIAPDSLTAMLPETTPEMLALISSDWMRGDTVRATFIENPALADDPAATERVLDRLMAAGSPAVSVYRMHAENSTDERLSINYLTAARIEVAFVNGAVSVVSAEGNARGMYLQPAPPPATRSGSNGRGVEPGGQ